MNPAPFERLVAEPVGLTDIRIGYARSAGRQKLDRRIDALTAAGCRKIFADNKSGKNDLRPELKACHAFLCAGDTLGVSALDRCGSLARTLLGLADELAVTEAAPQPARPDHPACQLILAVFADAGQPMLARDLCEEGAERVRCRGLVFGGGRHFVRTGVASSRRARARTGPGSLPAGASHCHRD